MRDDLQSILLSAAQIRDRVADLGAEILARWDGENEITLVPIMTGGLIFAADLMRCLPRHMQIHLMSVSSYPGRSTTSQGVKIDATLSGVPDDLTGRHVLVVDDILDSGRTLAAVSAELGKRNPAALQTCVLLRKQRPEALAFSCDHVAFDIPDEFVVGYGLDYDGYYRNLPDIGVLSTAAIAEGPGAG